MRQNFIALILAAGKGTRFKSEKIKVLHPLLGKSMLRFVVDCIFRLNPANIYVVVGYQKEEVKKETFSKKVEFVVQKERLGTAHAVLAAREILQKQQEKDVLVMNGDLVLLRAEMLMPMLKLHQKEDNSLTFLSAELENPRSFGRIIRGESNLIKIVEEKDATPSQRCIKESNVGVYLFKIKDLLEALPKISNKNKKGEYYLTDIIEIMSREKKKIGTYKTPESSEVIGINDRNELARAIEILRRRKIKSLAESGVTIYDPASTWIDLDVKIGRDTTIYPSVIVEGKSVIGKQCKIYPFSHVVDSKIGDRVNILTSTMIEKSIIKDDSRVGPFTHLRSKSVLMRGTKVGNFVEMKNTVFGRNSKAGHFSYLGDSEIEEDVNIGAGTITCNYDGQKKNKTVIEAGAFIGSGTELVAPVKVGREAYIGAGSTITKDVSREALAVARSKQVERPGWARRKRKKTD